MSSSKSSSISFLPNSKSPKPPARLLRVRDKPDLMRAKKPLLVLACSSSCFASTGASFGSFLASTFTSGAATISFATIGAISGSTEVSTT